MDFNLDLFHIIGKESNLYLNMNLDETALNIFTDGSSYSNPRKGGIGILFVWVNSTWYEETESHTSMGYKGATNNQMELQACIKALEIAHDEYEIDTYKKIVIYTDSSYVVENFQKSQFIWPQQKWTLLSGKPVLNAEQWKTLWKRISKIYERYRKRVEIKWVKWHAKNEHNKAVDKLAKQSAKISGKDKISIIRVRKRKFKEEKVSAGSVSMLGQRISIYIVTDEYLELPNIFRYKYQVISRKSIFFKKIDFICSREMLNAWHSYVVRFNKDSKNPLIVRLFSEIEKSKLL